MPDTLSVAGDVAGAGTALAGLIFLFRGHGGELQCVWRRVPVRCSNLLSSPCLVGIFRN